MAMVSLPVRAGERPETGPSVPHIQLSQNSPTAIRDELARWLADAFPGTRTGPSEISDPSLVRPWLATAFPSVSVAEDAPLEEAVALFLDGVEPAAGRVLMPPRLTAEIAHLHPDGSLHLALSDVDIKELVDKGWGEPHPLYSAAAVNVVMLFGPRDADEVEVAHTVLRAAYDHAVVA